MSVKLEELLEIAKKAAIQAGEAIMEIYETGDFSVEKKSDKSPLTIADRTAHTIISDILSVTNIPILSEEGADIQYEERSSWERFWMVDPLDGTKEFIKKNGEFTVNIALIEKGEPVMGVVYPPVLNELYYATQSNGAYMEHQGKTSRLNTTKSDLSESGIKVVASRSHMSEETKEYIAQFDSPEILSQGSSLKFLLVASGQADLYPRFGPTMEWDTAAAHAIVSEAGGRVTLADATTPLSYNKQDLLNPFFLVLPS